MRKQKIAKRTTKMLDETIILSRKKGNGILKFLANISDNGELGRYSLTYINLHIYNKDNGRVLGYDNDHGYHHRHYLGKVEKVDFISFNKIKNRLEEEWRDIHDKYQKTKT